MTAGEIAAAQSATTSIFQMFTDLMNGNIEIIFLIVGIVAVVGLMALLIRTLFNIVGVRRD